MSGIAGKLPAVIVFLSGKMVYEDITTWADGE